MSAQVSAAIDNVIGILEKAVVKGDHTADEIKGLHLQVSAALTPLAIAAMNATPAPSVAAPSVTTSAATPATDTPPPAPGPRPGTAALLAKGLREMSVLIEQFYQMNGNLILLGTIQPQLRAMRESIAHL